MYITSKQTTMECCLSVSIYFMLLPCQSISSQPSISFVRVLNYEFPFNIPVFVRFRTPVYPAPNYFEPDPIFDDKMRIRKLEREFSICFHPYIPFYLLE
jgi:hypothetical protein